MERLDEIDRAFAETLLRALVFNDIENNAELIRTWEAATGGAFLVHILGVEFNTWAGMERTSSDARQKIFDDAVEQRTSSVYGQDQVTDGDLSLIQRLVYVLGWADDLANDGYMDSRVKNLRDITSR